jgi:hypothetical protein
MNALNWIGIFILLSQFNFKYISGLSCYECDSSKDDYCPETWDRDDIEPVDCNEHLDYPAFCAKTTGIYGAIVGVRRFCASRHMDNSCLEVNIPQDPRTYYSCIYTCTTDGCNTASGLFTFKKSFILIVISLISCFSFCYFI